MLYVQQSLSPDERLIHIGRFHWVYVGMAISWIFIGLLFSYLIIHVAVYMDVTSVINNRYSGLSEAQEAQAWQAVIQSKGGWISTILHLHIGVKVASVTFLMVGLLIFVGRMITLMVTEIAVTNFRIIYKTGLISRHIDEINIDRVEGTNVNQSILGRIFGYGQVTIRGMGVGEVAFPKMLVDPIKFKMAVKHARSKSRQTGKAV